MSAQSSGCQAHVARPPCAHERFQRCDPPRDCRRLLSWGQVPCARSGHRGWAGAGRRGRRVRDSSGARPLALGCGWRPGAPRERRPLPYRRRRERAVPRPGHEQAGVHDLADAHAVGRDPASEAQQRAPVLSRAPRARWSMTSSVRSCSEAARSACVCVTSSPAARGGHVALVKAGVTRDQPWRSTRSANMPGSRVNRFHHAGVALVPSVA